MTEPPRIDDADFVAGEYADEARLAARAAFWHGCDAPQPQDVARQRICELAPEKVLEVGCGQGDFAAVAANYMLYHVPDIPRALGEIARVLRSGGALVAVTNSERKLHEMWELAGRERDPSTFSRENAEALLAPDFKSVERIDIDRRFTVTAMAIRDYIRATRFAELADNIPALPDGLVVSAAGSVLIATT